MSWFSSSQIGVYKVPLTAARYPRSNNRRYNILYYFRFTVKRVQFSHKRLKKVILNCKIANYCAALQLADIFRRNSPSLIKRTIREMDSGRLKEVGRLIEIKTIEKP